MDPTQGTTPQDDDIDTRTPEQIAQDAADDALFEAGFNTANGDEPGTKASTSSATTAAPAAAATGTTGTDDDDLEDGAGTGTGTAPAAGTAQPQENEDDAPVVLTRRQLAELTGTRDVVLSLQNELRRTVDSTNGRIGSLQQTLKEVKEQASRGVRPSFEQMEALEEDFPELAAVLKRDLGRIFGAGNETQPEGQGGDASGADASGAAPTNANPLEAPEVRAALRDAQLAIVDARHDGWRALPATPEWATWAAQLPPVQQELLRTTRDAATLSDALDDFKAFQRRQAAAASASNQRGKRLEHAVPATTGSSTGHAHIPSEDEIFEAGFKKARG